MVNSTRERSPASARRAICDVGEIGEARRRLDLQAAAVADVDRLDDEARRQRRDDRRNAQRPDQQVVGGADRRSRRRAPPASPTAIMQSLPSMTFMATALASPILAGSDRSTLPGPSVMTNICPTPTMTGEDRERQRRRDHAAGAIAAGEGDRREPDQQRADEGPDPGLGEQLAQRAAIVRASLRLISDARGQHDDEDGAVGGDLPVGRDVHEGEQRRGGQRQRQRADHRADRRDAAADEFAAAEDHAGDREQRVAVADIGVGRGGDADQRHAGQHAEQRPPARTCVILVLEQRPAGALDRRRHCRRTPRRIAP